MMKISKYILLASVLGSTVLFQGCTLSDQSCSFWQPVAWHTISKNRNNMRKLRIGMTKKEVVDVMGEPRADYAFNSANVWWYYTKMRVFDLQVVREECSPVVFDENTGLLAGFGNSYYHEKHRLSIWSDSLVERNLR